MISFSVGSGIGRNFCARALCGFDDAFCRLVDQLVVERFQSNPDSLCFCHVYFLLFSYVRTDYE